MPNALAQAYKLNPLYSTGLTQTQPAYGNPLSSPIIPLNIGSDVSNVPTQNAEDSNWKFSYDKKLTDPFAPVAVSALDWKPDVLSQLSGYGISEIPSWMQYLGRGSQRETSDLASGINRALNIDPAAWLGTAGKRSGAMNRVGISKAANGKLYDAYGREVAWDDTNKAAVQQAYLNRLTKENYGGFNPMGQEMFGLATVLAPIAIASGAYGGGLLEGGAVAGGLEGAGGGAAGLGGLELGADLGSGVIAGGGLGEAAGGAAGGLGGLELGADVGMGAGTNLFTSLGAPASYSVPGQAGYLGANALSGGGMFDSIGGVLNSGWGNLIQGGLGALGSYLGGQEMSDAADKSADVLWRMYNQNRSDMSPLLSLLGTYAPQFAEVASKGGADYTNDPIYQADKEEMIRTLNRGQSSKGSLRSSDTDNAMTRNLSTLMNNAYARKYGGLLDLLKLGSGAASSAGASAANTGNALANVYGQAGNAQANMIGGMFGSGMGALNNYQLYNLLAAMNK